LGEDCVPPVWSQDIVRWRARCRLPPPLAGTRRRRSLRDRYSGRPPAEVRGEQRERCSWKTPRSAETAAQRGAAAKAVMPMRGSSAPPVKPLGGSNVSNAVRCSWSLGRWPRHDERAKRASPASAGVEGGSAGIGRASARCLALNGGRRSLPPVKTPWRNCREPQPAAERPAANHNRWRNSRASQTGGRTAAPLPTPTSPSGPPDVALLRADRPVSKNPDMVPSSASKPSILRFCRRETLCPAPDGGYTQQPM
ncbi:MAG: hypothetical protein JWM18_83, partial [Chloroflexi bacterium]|nr:hypothetical protein [Chloroflexota bacterium]